MKDLSAFPVLLATIGASLGAFVLGFTLGFPSPIQTEVEKLGILDDATFPIFSSCNYFVAILGALFVLFVTDHIGRKTLIILFTLPNAIGYLMIASGYNGTVMIFGRGLTGITWGAISTLTPVYIADIAPKRLKGLYGSFFNHSLLSGIFTSHFLGIFLTFRGLALVPILVNFLQCLLMFWQPYSPTWLVSGGLEKQALNILRYLRGSGNDCISELFQIKQAVRENSLTLFQRFRAMFSELRYLKTLLIMCICFSFVSLTGISVVTSYSASILSSSRLIPPKVASLIPSLVQTISSFLCTILVDRVGRKPLLIASSAGIAFCFALLSSYNLCSRIVWLDCSTVQEITNSTNSVTFSVEFCDYITLLPIIAMLILRFSFGIGWGPVSYILLGEAFPAKIRSVAASFAIIAKLIFAGLPALLFPYLESAIGAGYVFLIFMFVNISSGIFVYVFVPETKRKSMDEIEALYKERTIYVTCACKP